MTTQELSEGKLLWSSLLTIDMAIKDNNIVSMAETLSGILEEEAQQELKNALLKALKIQREQIQNAFNAL